MLLEWDSGNLAPEAVRRDDGEPYRLDRGKCRGVKELFILLAHLYGFEHGYMIIDDPEHNLRPQYQAFRMKEVRKIAGKPDFPRTRRSFS